MPLAHPSHVVSFSSEDPHHPASNLLNRETFRKWKCKECGEKEAFVILKFDKAQEINSIDIGNDGSALVEVSVARSGNGGEPQFEVLLSSTAFMSPLDSREGKNLNGVKNFSAHSLSKPISSQKWDLVKVQVSQPFNRHVQYGLTFIKFMVAPDPNEPKKIGLFGFRKAIGGEDSDDDDLRPGMLFSRKLASTKKDPAINSSPKPTSSLSTNAVIQEASKKLANASKSANDDEVKSLLRKPKSDLDLPSPSPSPVGSKGVSSSGNNSPLIKRKQLPDAPNKSKAKSSIVQSPSSSSSPKTSNGISKKRTLSPDPQTSGSTNSPSTSKKGGTPAKKPKKARKTKPFNKLLDGVVFSMSGFENPLRGQLRDKAVEMGARYKADWDRSCTHLICAFYNTPKFRQVKGAGNGKIVKKNWIEKSFADKCRYPWRRYCLDKNDQGSESEEDIYAEQNDEEEFLDDETEAEQQTNDNEDELNSKVKRKWAFVLESSDEDEKNDEASKKAYDADTDIDEDRTPDLSPSLMDEIPSSTSQLFQGKTFCLNLNEASPNSQDNSLLESIIIKHNGKIHKTLKDSTEYFVCQSSEWTDDFADALSDNPNLILVHKNWILECDKDDALIEMDSFMLSPS